MYCLSDAQIEFILNDIRARGVEMDSLQQDILDHVCCIIEQSLDENGDFKAFYSSTIQRFYKKELKEIEDETISLITNKHYYTMKKVMVYSGTISASLMSIGIFFKFMYWPGASVCIVLGVAGLSLVFLPLMVALKIKEGQKAKDKWLAGLGAISGILMILSVLFRVQHWPGAMVMGYSCIGMLLLVFLPILLTTGLRNPDTKVNTIVTSVLLVTGCCMWLTLVASPTAVRISNIRATQRFLSNEQLLQKEQNEVARLIKSDTVKNKAFMLSDKINSTCEHVKGILIERETGEKSIGNDFKDKGTLLVNLPFNLAYDSVYYDVVQLKKNVEEYNALVSGQANTALQAIPVSATVLDMGGDYNVDALNDFTRIEMFVLQNERLLVCNK